MPKLENMENPFRRGFQIFFFALMACTVSAELIFRGLYEGPKPSMEFDSEKENYIADAYGYRLTPQPKSLHHKKDLVFIGGLYTFGAGVGPKETLPARVASITHGYKVYNLGQVGGGPHNILARLEGLPPTLLEKKEGVYVYVMIGDHVRRPLGPLSYVSQGGGDKPYYALEDDKPVHHGTFETGRPLITKFYQLLGKSRIIQHLNLDLPRVFSPKQLHFVALLVKQIQNTLEVKWGAQRFYVLIWPGATKAQQLIPDFERLGISYLDYSQMNLTEILHNAPALNNQGRPVAGAYKIIAEKLAKDLSL